MKLFRNIAVKSFLTGAAFCLVFALLPAFLITGQIEGFSILIDEIFKGQKG